MKCKPFTPGVVALMQYDDGRLFEFNMGVENTITNKKINRDSIFDIASVSKQFTAFSILLLEKNGDLELTDKISKYMPEALIFECEISIENLIYHTSGLPCLFDIAEKEGVGFFSEFSNENIISAIFKERKLNFIPGTKFEYSNTGYILLARIVEIISGKKFSKFVKSEIFDPLSMKNSFVSSGLIKERFSVTGYELNEKKEFSPVFSPWGVIGAGLVFSTANDLMKWGMNFSSGFVGGKELIKKMLTPLPVFNGSGIKIEGHSPYCFGIERDEDSSGEIYCHLGSTFGGESYFIRSEYNGFTLVALSNVENYDVSATADNIFNGMLKLASNDLGL